MKKIYVHSISSHGSWYFYQSVECAVRLASVPSFATDSVVELIFHPVTPLSRPFLLRLCGYIKTCIENPKRIGLKIISYTNRLGDNQLDTAAKMHLPSAGVSSLNTDESLYSRVLVNGERVKISLDHGDIYLSRSKNKLYDNLLVLLSSALKAAWLGRKSLFYHRIASRELLQIKYKDTPIGDLVASTALRLNPNAGGSIHRCRSGLFCNLVNAVAIRDYIGKYISPIASSSYVVVPEPTYNDSIYKRAIHQLGGTVIESHHYSGRLKLVPSSCHLKNPGIVRVNNHQSIQSLDTAAISSYFDARIKNSSSSLWYMFNGSNNNSDSYVYDEYSCEVDISSGSLSAVVFLHSFDDGQYYYGPDDFDDLYHWTIFTIDSLLANKAITHILIKTHPNVDFERHKGDYHGISSLRKRYANCFRIVWLRSNTSVVALSSLDHLIGITHHGSVAEELSYLQVPVIASNRAPWGSLYPFLKTWNTVDEYKSLLISLTIDSLPQVNPSIFNQFVYEYRIRSSGIYSASMRVRFARALGISASSFPKLTGRLSRRLDTLRLDSEDFLILIDDMLKEASDSPFVYCSLS